MEGEGGMGCDVEREEEEEEEEEVTNPLRDRFRLCTISIAESQEQLAKELELFAQHAGRKSVNMEDVILSAHRNHHLAASLRCFCDGIKGKEAQSERKRKKGSRKADKAAHIDT